MGVILDSSVIIAGERRGRTVRQILEQMTAPERQKVVEKTPKQSYRTTVGPRFFFWIAVLRRVVFCKSRLLRAVSLCLKCSTFKRSPYESDGQEQRESSPSHSPPNIYKSEGPESRLPNCPHSDHAPIPRTMDNA